MIPDARPAFAPARPRRSEADDGGAQGSTVLRGDGPGREAMRSRAWRLGAGSVGRESRRPGLDPWRSPLPSVVHEFTAAWERGESPRAEDYLRRLDPADRDGAVDLIYREFCLAEANGLAPDPESYIARFPRYAEALRRLLDVHGACSPSLLGRLLGPPPIPAGSRPRAEPGSDLPQAGDTIGPYVLRRELGRGSFARVFLAEEEDLANRLVVIKIATRSTREPWLLARARHAHIVEILSHAVVDDGAFQLICMPFWGGATLADVLAARPGASRPSGRASGPGLGGFRARRRAGGPTTGADLLAALDAAAAPEYPSVHPARPAREILAPLPYDRAIAWVIARLAEALDHAASRDVTHGDVKPSNILLSADGNPMLLDFNLAREGAPAVDASGRPIDPGGTLAYMAPERLRALASWAGPRASASGPLGDGGLPAPLWSRLGGGGPPLAGPVPAGGGWPASDRSVDQAAHVADIYALGVVLLEALSGRPPFAAAPMPGGPGADPGSRPARLTATARAYATARERPARALIRDVEVASGRPIAPALRAILGRCLDPDPARRYRRALELAEDLDRWRTDRPLAYADEPFWGEVVPRWLRLKRRGLIVAAVSLLAVGLAMTALALLGSNRLLRRDFEAGARAKLARHWDDPESGGSLRIQRVNAPLNSWAPDDPESFEVARRALRDYDLLGEGDLPAAGDWRLRDGVRYLSPADREDLEAWLMERAYVYGRALEDRPDSPDDWRRARDLLDRAGGPWSIRAWAPLRDRLAAKLGAATPPRATAPAPAWLDEHLLGFAAECRSEAEAAAAADPRAPMARARDRRTVLERALGHYDQVLAIRPGSFWAHYRAAAACFGLGRLSEAALATPSFYDPALASRRSSEAALASRRFSEAAHHLARCLERRPGNAVIRMQLAGCLFALKRYPEALVACDRALELAPGYAELYRSRAYARLFLRQTAGLDDEVRRFEMLSRILPRRFWDGAAAADPAPAADRPIASVLRGLADLGGGPARGAGRGRVVGVDPDEIETRATFAEFLREAEQLPLAEAEVEKILALQPDHIPSRMMRVEQAILDRRFDAARADIDAVMDHLGLEDYVRGHIGTFHRLFNITRLYLEAGRAGDARGIAERTKDLAIESHLEVGAAHYNLAQVYAVLGATDPLLIEEAAKQLFRAFLAHPDILQWYRHRGHWFDPVRTRIDAALARMEDPMEVRRRLMAASSAKAPTRVAER